jgi:REP element-mobilizing transposase RayT
MTYWRLHYHLIWSTQDRLQSITPEREKMFYGVLYNKGDELGLLIHAAGNVEDHVHVIASIPPKLAVADCVRHLKGASAHAINHMEGSDGQFKWQAGYAALSVSEDFLEKLMNYARNQKEHHKSGTTVDVYERMDEEG